MKETLLFPAGSLFGGDFTPLATAEFTTLRSRLLKIAVRIIETATRVRIAFAAACPEAELFRGVASSLQPGGL